MSKQEVIICHNLEENLNKAITQCPHDKLFVLADEHTRKLCIPVLSGFDCIKNAHFIYIGAEDVHKNLETLAYVWKELGDKGASRHSLLINLGGGMRMRRFPEYVSRLFVMLFICWAFIIL